MMNLQTMFSTIILSVIVVTNVLQLCNGNPTCKSSDTKVEGEFINSTKDRYFTGQPFKTITNSTTMKCSMVLTAILEAKAMNVLGENQRNVTCQLFEVGASDGLSGGGLVEKEGANYYEKLDKDSDFIKATPNAIVVGAKGNNPGVFNFQLLTGDYRVKLYHLTGGLKTNENLPFKNFGSIHSDSPSAILLMKGYKENTVVQARSFTKYDGDIIKTKFVATSECFNLIQESMYSFWFSKDLKNNDEEDNYGETSFEMFVQLCEKSTECT